MNLEEIKAKVETATPTEFVILCRKYFMPLIAEVERLTKDYNDQDNAHHKLFMAYCEQQKQIATLKKALELAEEARTPNPEAIKKLSELHIRQAQEQEGKK